MATDKQIAANPENAKKSTGPTSEKGKNKVRLNAIRDNLTGQITTLSDEDRPRFEKLQSEMLTDFAPQSSIERELAASVIWDTWRLHHLRSVEGAIYALGVAEEAAAAEAEAEAKGDADPNNTDGNTATANAHTFLAEAPRFNTMSLYEQRMNRSLHRNLAILREIQKERKRLYEADKKEEVAIARFQEVHGNAIQVTTRKSKNGFVFSSDEIALACVRKRRLETAIFALDDISIQQEFDDHRHGLADTFLTRLENEPPIEEQLRNTEAIVLRRQSHPEAFGIAA